MQFRIVLSPLAFGLFFLSTSCLAAELIASNEKRCQSPEIPEDRCAQASDPSQQPRIVSLAEVSSQLEKRLGIGDAGVLYTTKTPASLDKIISGDIILTINGFPAINVDVATALIARSSIAGRRTVLLLIKRGQSAPKYIGVPPTVIIDESAIAAEKAYPSRALDAEIARARIDRQDEQKKLAESEEEDRVEQARNMEIYRQRLAGSMAEGATVAQMTAEIKRNRRAAQDSGGLSIQTPSYSAPIGATGYAGSDLQQDRQGRGEDATRCVISRPVTLNQNYSSVELYNQCGFPVEVAWCSSASLAQEPCNRYGSMGTIRAMSSWGPPLERGRQIFYAACKGVNSISVAPGHRRYFCKPDR